MKNMNNDDRYKLSRRVVIIELSILFAFTGYKMKKIDLQLSEIKSKIGSADVNSETKADQIDGNLDDLTKKINYIKATLNNLDERVSRLEERKLNSEQFELSEDACQKLSLTKKVNK